MKKWMCLLTAAMIALSLCGCGLKNLKNVELPPLPQITEPVPTLNLAPTAMPETEATPVPTVAPAPTPAPVPTPAPTPEFSVLKDQIVVNIRRTALEQMDPESGSKRILTFSYETPVVSIEGREQVSGAINTALATQDEFFYSGSDESIGFGGMLELAEDTYTHARQEGQEMQELSSSRSVRVERADSAVISLVYRFREDTGSHTPPYGEEGCVFDSQTGKLLALEDLCGDYAVARTTLVQLLVNLTITDESLYDHLYTSYIPNMDFYAKLSDLLRPGAWYFDSEGMVFTSSLYELGPYIAGLCTFHIPYAQLEGVIDAKWLPTERAGGGTVQLTALESVASGSMPFVDRVPVDTNGQEFCLVAQGKVYDVQVWQVHYENGFVLDHLLWYCDRLEDAAVQLAAALPEGLPNRMICYTNAAGETSRLLLTVDGATGAGRLAPESEVQPVG